jgi:hypothetical protein
VTILTEAPTPSGAAAATPETRLVVEYWTVTMDGEGSCASCDDTLDVVNEAVAMIRPLAQHLGMTIELVPRTVATWSDAVDHEIAASPTVRAAGIELRPSHPDTSDTRIWNWRGTTSMSLPPQAVLDLLVQAVSDQSSRLGEFLVKGGPTPYVRQFLQEAPAAAAKDLSPTGCCG